MKTKLLRRIGLHATFFVFFIFVINISFAQDEGQLEAILNEINSLYTSKIEEAAKRDQNRFNKMKSELEEIEKINENQGKKKAVENYSKNNKAAYGQIVREAGVNPNSVVARLKSKFPGYTFSVIEDYSILVERTVSESDPSGGTGSLTPQKNSPSDGKKIDPDIYPATTSPDFRTHYPIYNDVFLASNGKPGRGPMTEAVFETNNEFPSEWFSGIISTQELSFTQRKSVNCAAGSGGNVEFGARYVKAWSTGVVVGDCSSSGNLENYTSLPVAGVQTIKLILNITSEINGYAFGIIGTSLTTASSGFSVQITSNWQNVTVGYLGKTAIAPFLWYASFNESKNFSQTIDLTPWKGSTIRFSGSGGSRSTAALCCATNSTGRVTINTARLEILK